MGRVLSFGSTTGILSVQKYGSRIFYDAAIPKVNTISEDNRWKWPAARSWKLDELANNLPPPCSPGLTFLTQLVGFLGLEVCSRSLLLGMRSELFSLMFFGDKLVWHRRSRRMHTISD